MALEWIDIGCNLTHVSFAHDRDRVLARARAAGVTRQIVTGADPEGSRAAAALAAAHPGVLWSTAGVHPHHAAQFDAAAGAEIERLLALEQVVAVGECGLDYFRDFSPRAAQRAAFIAQLTLAEAVGKPVFLHQRDAHADFRDILADHCGRLRGGVAHCFTGDVAELEDYLGLGLHIGITGWICDERRGAHLREAVTRVPADRLMLETDAPYLLPRDLGVKPASRRNEPCHLPHVAKAVAAARGESLEILAGNANGNAVKFFGLKAR